MILIQTTPTRDARAPRVQSMQDAYDCLNTAIFVEFSTLPPYLYALYSIKPGTNARAYDLVRSIAMEEMIHMCLACNMLNAIGGTPDLITTPSSGNGGVPRYPHPLLKIADGQNIRLLPFSKPAIHQGMMIEMPDFTPIIEHGPVAAAAVAEAGKPTVTTIAQLYDDVLAYLKTLPPSAWHKDRNQLRDNQFLVGEIFPINSFDDALRAKDIIVEEGEGSRISPLDQNDDLAHYYKFSELYYNAQIIFEDDQSQPAWGPSLDIDWGAAYAAIPDPSLATYDACHASLEARRAQDACGEAYTSLVRHLQAAVTGQSGMLGVAARDMFDLRMAAQHALTVPLNGATDQVAGPAFLFETNFADGANR